MPAPLLIADIPWLLYRSYFALPTSIVDGQGRPANALLGTVNALVALIDARAPARRPRAVVACMGAEQAEYRVRLYPAYHAQREPMPPELAAQWELAPALLESFGWTVAATQTLEADDVMFSFARVEAEAGGRALLLTADRDLYGAVCERVAVLDLRKDGDDAEIGPGAVRERYGVDPQFVPDFIALRGDPSDGIPGAPGVGAKTAAELLRRYGSLEDTLLAARESAAEGTAAHRRVRPRDDQMRPRIAATLRENEALLLTFKQIATLQRVAVVRPPDRATDLAGGARMAHELGMKRLAARLHEMARG